MARNDDTPPATKTYRLWADHVRRMFQDVDAPDPQQAYNTARDRPECWQDCFEHEDRDDYHLSNEVQDTETEEYHRVRGASRCTTSCGEIAAAGDGSPSGGCEAVPAGTVDRARLRVVFSGEADFEDGHARQAAQHFAVAAMRPDDPDEIGGIIADLEQFPDAGRYAALFAAAPGLRRASQELYDRLQEYLDVSDTQLIEQGYSTLVEAMDALEAAWHEADHPADDMPVDTPEDAERRIWCLRLAADRERARRKDSFRRYFALHAEEKIRLALEILGDVSADWDNDTLEHYPDGLGSFDEFLTELGMKLCAIRWARPGRPPADADGEAA